MSDMGTVPDANSRCLALLEELLSLNISKHPAKAKLMCVTLNRFFTQANVSGKAEFLDPFLEIIRQHKKSLHESNVDTVWENSQPWQQWQNKIANSPLAKRESTEFPDIKLDLDRHLPQPLSPEPASLALALQTFNLPLAVPFFALMEDTIKQHDDCAQNPKTDTQRLAMKIVQSGYLNIKDMNRMSFYYSKLDTLGASYDAFVAGARSYKDLIALTTFAGVGVGVVGPVGYCVLQVKPKLVEEKEGEPSLRNVTVVIGSVDCRGCPIIGEIQFIAHQPSNPDYSFFHHLLYELERLVGYPPDNLRAELCHVVQKIYSRAAEVEKLTKRPAFASLRPVEISMDEIDLSNEVVGSGTFKIAQRAEFHHRQVIFAKYMKWDETTKSSYNNEALLMSRIRHPNLVELIGCCSEKRAIVMEYCPQTLQQVLMQHAEMKPRTVWSTRRKLAMMAGAARGLSALHLRNVMHRDIKPDNIFVSGNMLKIGDLGSAKQLKCSGVNTPDIGAPMYRAPENADYGCPADVYSFACVLYQLLAATATFELPTEQEYASFDPAPLVPLLQRCWDFDPSARPSIFEVAEMLQLMSGAENHRGGEEKKSTKLDVAQLVASIEERQDANMVLAAKDLVIILGETGAGKTLALNYLAGKTMRTESKIFYNKGVEMESTDVKCDDALPGFEVGCEACSKTRVVRMHTSDGLNLCDSPGFYDTAGATVEIANAFEIAHVVKRAARVVIVLCIKWSSADGNRGHLLPDLIADVFKFIPGLSDNFSALVPVVTHVPPDKTSAKAKRELNAKLLNIADALDKTDSEKIQIEKFLEVLLLEQDLLLCPLESNAALLRRIKAAVPLCTTTCHFLPLSSNSKEELQAYRERISEDVPCLLQESKFGEVGMIFRNLQIFSAEVSWVQDATDALISRVSRFLAGTVEAGVGALAMGKIAQVARYFSVLQQVGTAFWDVPSLSTYKEAFSNRLAEACRHLLREVDQSLDFNVLKPLLQKSVDLQTHVGHILPCSIVTQVNDKMKAKEMQLFKDLLRAIRAHDFEKLTKLGLLHALGKRSKCVDQSNTHFEEVVKHLCAAIKKYCNVVEEYVCGGATSTEPTPGQSIQGLFHLTDLRVLLEDYLPQDILNVSEGISKRILLIAEIEVEKLRSYQSSDEFKLGRPPPLKQLHFLSTLEVPALTDLTQTYQTQCAALVVLGQGSLDHAIQHTSNENMAEFARFLRQAKVLIECNLLEPHDVVHEKSLARLKDCEKHIVLRQKSFLDQISRLGAPEIVRGAMHCILPFVADESQTLLTALKTAGNRLRTVLHEGALKARLLALRKCEATLDNNVQLSTIRAVLEECLKDLQRDMKANFDAIDIKIGHAMARNSYGDDFVRSLDQLRELSCEELPEIGLDARMAYRGRISALKDQIWAELEGKEAECIQTAFKRAHDLTRLYSHLPDLRAFHSSLKKKLGHQNEAADALKTYFSNGQYDYALHALKSAQQSWKNCFCGVLVKFLLEKSTKLSMKSFRERATELGKLSCLVSFAATDEITQTYGRLESKLNIEIKSKFDTLERHASSWQWADLTCLLAQLDAPEFSWAGKFQDLCLPQLEGLELHIRDLLSPDAPWIPALEAKSNSLKVHLPIHRVAPSPISVTRKCLAATVNAWFEPLLRGEDWDPHQKGLELRSKFMLFDDLCQRLTHEQPNILRYFPRLQECIVQHMDSRAKQLTAAHGALFAHCLTHLNSNALSTALKLADTLHWLDLFDKFAEGNFVKSQIADVRMALEHLIKSAAKVEELRLFFHEISESYPALKISVQHKITGLIDQRILECKNLISPSPNALIIERLDHIRALCAILGRSGGPQVEVLEAQLKLSLDTVWAEYQRSIKHKNDETSSEKILVQFLCFCPQYRGEIESRRAQLEELKSKWKRYLAQVENGVFENPALLLHAASKLGTEQFRIDRAFTELCNQVGEYSKTAVRSPVFDEKSPETEIEMSAGAFKLHAFCNLLTAVGTKRGLSNGHLADTYERLENYFVRVTERVWSRAHVALGDYQLEHGSELLDPILNVLAGCLRQVAVFEKVCIRRHAVSLESLYMDKVKKLCDEYREFLETGGTEIKADGCASFLIKIYRWVELINSIAISDCIVLEIKAFLHKISGLVPAIGSRLQSGEGTGRKIVQEFEVFKIERNKLFNEQTGNITAEQVLTDICRKHHYEDVKSRKLRDAWAVYQQEVESQLKFFFDRGRTHFAVHLESPFGVEPALLLSNIPKYLAHIAAVFSFKKSGGAVEDLYQCRPHPMQIISILCMLLNQPDPAAAAWNRHIVEIGTGEGKSIILALLAAFLALAGFEVDVVCYSKMLVNRDFADFRELFRAFDVANNINYGTFRDIAENFLDQVGDIRQLTLQALRRLDGDQKQPPTSERQRILLIDEIDVFVQSGFYGSILQPVAQICTSEVRSLIEYIYDHPDTTMLLVQQQKSYVDIASTCYSRPVQEFFTAQIQLFLDGVKKYEMTKYSVVTLADQTETIAYLNASGGLDTTVFHRGISQFHFLQEFRNGRISEEHLNASMGLTFPVGSFAYAEIPNHYHGIFGVTATFEILGEYEKKVLEEKYCLSKTITTSIYGPKRLEGARRATVLPNKDTHFLFLLNKIAEYHSKQPDKVKVPILIFFPNDDKIDEFVSHEKVSKWFRPLEARGEVFQIKTSTENFDHWMGKSMEPGKITLLPAVFGRGLDFKCYERRVDESGGVHVIQMFLSSEVSEEVQIRGRTARQNHKGTYLLCVSLSDLIEPFNIKEIDMANILHQSEDVIYEFLNRKRQGHYSRVTADRKEAVKRAALVHKKTWDHLNKMVNGQIDSAAAARFLLTQGSLPQPWYGH